MSTFPAGRHQGAFRPHGGVYWSLVNVTEATLDKLAFGRVRDALAERCASQLGIERVQALAPGAAREQVERTQDRVEEVVEGGDLSLGGVRDVRPLVERVHQTQMLEGREILEIAYTMGRRRLGPTRHSEHGSAGSGRAGRTDERVRRRLAAGT